MIDKYFLVNNGIKIQPFHRKDIPLLLIINCKLTLNVIHVSYRT